MSTHTLIADYHNPKHAEDILYLLEEYAQHPMIGAKPLPDFTKENLISTLTTIPGAFSVLCYVDEQPAGLINCFQGFSTFKCKPLINLHDVMVSADFRGRSLTRLMIGQVEEVARERGCCKLTLEVVEKNLTAQRAYKALGFESYELDTDLGVAYFWDKAL